MTTITGAKRGELRVLRQLAATLAQAGLPLARISVEARTS